VAQFVRVIVMDKEGRILLFHFGEANKWGLPGGKVDQGETPKAAAVRELEGETGLLGSPRFFLRVASSKTGRGVLFHTFFTRFELLRKTRPPRRPVIWTDKSKIQGMIKWEPRYRE